MRGRAAAAAFGQLHYESKPSNQEFIHQSGSCQNELVPMAMLFLLLLFMASNLTRKDSNSQEHPPKGLRFFFRFWLSLTLKSTKPISKLDLAPWALLLGTKYVDDRRQNLYIYLS